jgi:hypothetical protein
MSTIAGEVDGSAARGRRARRIGRALGLVAATTAVALSSLAAPAEAAAPKGAFRGEAYGATATAVAGPLAAQLGKIANLPCPCKGTNGQLRTNSVDAVAVGTLGAVLRADAVTSTVLARKTATAAEVTNTATITGLNALGGLTTATSLKAVANTTATATATTSNADGSRFVDLVIAGQAIAANPAPNTKIEVPALGTVTLNKRVVAGGGRPLQTITVEALSIEVKAANSFGLPVGAKIVLAHAASGFSRTDVAAFVGGQAYAALANAKVGSVIQNRIGRQALVTLGCEGTGGVTRSNNVAAIAAGNVLRTGAGATTAFGGRDGTGTIARTTARVENATLLSGGLGALISFDAITVVAEDKWNGSVHARSFAGTRFAGLRVLGINLPVDVAPNTRIDLPLLGHVVVNEQIAPPAAAHGMTRINGLHLVVTKTNPLGLPVGSDIVVAHADANANL